ncbi:hypothetical protein AB1L42_03950 [Thalassoglobus sp. JC818]|uniref:hypothetical protein n=1 Tax=Thalassoglobus sp. JC818 TaxID=3232136 RepID=UPI00345A60A0
MQSLASLRLFAQSLCVLTVVAFTSVAVLAQPAPRSDQRLPPDVFFYATTPDVPASFDQFQQTPWGQLIYGPEMTPFREHIVEWVQNKMAESGDRVEADLGYPPSDLVALIDGEAAFAVLRPLGGALGVVAFVETGDHDDILQPLLEKIDSKLADEEKVTTTTETIAGTEIKVYSIQTDTPQMPIVNVCYFVKDGTVTIGSSVDILDAVLERWDGEHTQTFEKNSFYQQLLARCQTSDGSEPDSIYFVTPVQLTLGILQSIPDTQFFGAMAAGFLPQFGVNTLRGAGATVELNAEDFATISRSLLIVDQPTTGIFKAFQFRPTFTEISDWVPADASGYFAFDWDLLGAYDTIENLYDTWIGRQPGSFEKMVTQATRRADGFDLHIRDDVLATFTGQFELFFASPQGDDPNDVDGTAAIGITDPEKAQKLIDLALEQADSVEEGTISGNAVTLVSSGGKDFVVAIHDGTVYITRSEERAQQIFDGLPDNMSLKQSKNYLRAEPHLPESYSFFSYQDAATGMKANYEKLRNGEFDSATEGEIDFSLLPPYEEISKYFVPSFSFCIPTDEGPYTEQFTLPIDE